MKNRDKQFHWSTQMGLEGEVSILGFKKAQVFCIKNSSCVKTGKSLRAIETSIEVAKDLSS